MVATFVGVHKLSKKWQWREVNIEEDDVANTDHALEATFVDVGVSIIIDFWSDPQEGEMCMECSLIQR